ncbi:glycosyltransferase [Methylobacterium sp. JK268]
MTDPQTVLLREAGPVPAARLACIAAIPVRNEAERIGACLRALSVQDGVAGFGIVLFLNNCTDGTAREVAALRGTLPVPLRVIACVSDRATAGWARREAMEAAASWLEEVGSPDGVILTTDADSRVPADWVRRSLAALADGADAVAGRIALDPDEAARLPESLHARGRLESRYEALLTEIAARIDPRPDDPWPCHWTDSGASLAVRLSVYRRVGGLPPLALGEDRAFVAALRAADARVRHEPGIVVVTSGRLEGRAPGGAADTMRLRCAAPESPCDPRLEPLLRALRRYAWRRRLRDLHAAGRLGRTGLWAPRLGLRRAEAEALARLPTLGALLDAVEGASPHLAPRRLCPSRLPAEIRRARAALVLLRLSDRLRRATRRERPLASVPLAAAAAEHPGHA